MLKTLMALLLVGLWLTGCAGSRAPDPAAAKSGSEAAVSEDPADIDDPTYLMLVAEIAGQRGRFEMALDYYMRLLQITTDPGVAARATQVAVFIKDGEKAQAAAETWASLEPDSIQAHRLNLLLKVRAEEPDPVAEEIAALVRLKDPDLENTLVETARWVEAEKSKEAGMSLFRALADRFPNLAEVQLAAAYLASESGLRSEATTLTDTALRLHPGWSRALMLKAQLQLQAGDGRAARLSLEQARRHDPANPRLGVLYGQFLAKAGDFRAAEQTLAEVLGRDPANQEARFALASVWMEMGEGERARKEFDFLSADPRWQAQSLFSMALIDARAGRTEQALKGFDAITEGPLAFDARFNAISAEIALNHPEEARKRLAKAREAFPKEQLRLYLIEAELLVKRHDAEGAFALLTEAIEALPGQLELLYSRALVAEQINRLDVMESDLRVLLDKTPDDPAALNALGFSLAVHRPERLAEAEGYIRKALSQRPEDPAILDSLGWVLYRQGKAEAALAPLRKAYSLFQDPEIAAHLGEVLWRLNRPAEARRIWAEGARKDPDHEDLQRVRRDFPEAFSGGGR